MKKNFFYDLFRGKSLKRAWVQEDSVGKDFDSQDYFSLKYDEKVKESNRNNYFFMEMEERNDFRK